MSNRFIAALVVLMTIVATLVVLRVIVPGLINLHSDGLIVLAFVMVMGVIVGWYYALQFVIRLLKGDFD